ncbi:hypothetical protein GGI16_000565 [Coemansia sp. S142-1]|nr:hypothetical protein GGI16_000565 [Coemansia sp. S142-1]
MFSFGLFSAVRGTAAQLASTLVGLYMAVKTTPLFLSAAAPKRAVLLLAAPEPVTPEPIATEPTTPELIASEPAASDCAKFVDAATCAADDAYDSASAATLSANAADSDAHAAETASRAAGAADTRAFEALIGLISASDEAILAVSPAKDARNKASAAASDSKAAALKVGFYADAASTAADLAYAAMTETVAAADAGDLVAATMGAKAAAKAAADAKLAAANAAAAGNEASASSAAAIDASAHAEEVADSTEAKAAVAIAESRAALASLLGASRTKPLPMTRATEDSARAEPNPDDIFRESDFPPFDLDEVLGGGHHDAASLGYLLGGGAKASETEAKFEERFEAFQEQVHSQCEWVSGGRYFKLEDMLRARCYELNCLC